MKRFGKKAFAWTATALLAVTALSGCATKIDESEIVATVGDVEITAGFANFYARYQQSGLESMYQMYVGEDFWGKELSDGVTYEESTKDSLMTSLQELYLLDAHAGEYEVALTEEEQAAIDEAASSFDSANGSNVKEQVSGTKENAAEYLRLQTIAAKMKEAMTADVDTNVSDEEAAQKRLRYVKIDKVVYSDDGTKLDFTEEQLAEKLKEAEDILAGAKANGSLEAYATEKELQSTKLTFDAESTSLDEAVIAAADALKTGEFTEVMDTEGAYYVVQLENEFDEEATQTEKDSIVSVRKNDRYTELVDEWKEATEITVEDSVWNQISFESLKVNAKVEESSTEKTAE